MTVDITPENVARIMARERHRPFPYQTQGLETATLIDALAARVAELEAKLATARAEALEDAAAMVERNAYTNNGDRRSLEPVSAGLVGMDQHHATIAAAIRALIPEVKP